jgi:hypothetical protein
MERLKRLPWRRLLALLVLAAVMVAVWAQPVQGETRYVIVETGSPSAVLLDKASSFAKGIATLKRDQEVEVLDETALKEGKTYIKVRVKDGDKTLEGYVKRVILGTEKLTVDSEGSETVGATGAAKLSKGLNQGIEDDMVKQDPQKTGKAIEQINKLEAARNKELGGDAKNPDPSKMMENYRKFGQDGRLLEGN